MSHITKVFSLDGAEYLRVYQKLRCFSKCMSSFRKIDYSSGQADRSRSLNYPPSKSPCGTHLTMCLQHQQTGISLAFKQPVRFYSDLPEHKAITLPALSPTMEMGTIVSWEKKEGDQVKEGDLLAEIETDKATMGFEASEEGYLAKILVPAGAKGIPLGSVLCVLVSTEADIAKFASVTAADLGGAPPALKPQAAAAAAPAAPAAAAPAAPAAQAAPAAPAGGGDRIKASPYARLLAKEKGVQLASVTTASGADGRIVSVDVLNASAAGAKSPAPPVAATTAVAGTKAATATAAPGTDFVDLPLSNMRATIAKRLTYAKQSIPHYYLTAQAGMDAVLRVRQDLNKQLAGRGVKLSVNDFVIKAAAVALTRVPECNSAWHDAYIRQYSRADISIAVATDNGLITPIVFNADAKGLIGINSDVVRLAEKARSNKLKPQEFQGGTFTISNLGMFGIQSFAAIINPPQACILAVGGAQKILAPAETEADGATGFTTRTVMQVTLCCDHRVVDGAVGAKWLSEFKACLEDPYTMLL